MRKRCRDLACKGGTIAAAAALIADVEDSLREFNVPGCKHPSSQQDIAAMRAGTLSLEA